jgi:hypothetical protein
MSMTHEELKALAEAWYTRVQIISWLQRDRIVPKDYDALADFCIEHFRLAFIKGGELVLADVEAREREMRACIEEVASIAGQDWLEGQMKLCAFLAQMEGKS